MGNAPLGRRFRMTSVMKRSGRSNHGTVAVHARRYRTSEHGATGATFMWAPEAFPKRIAHLSQRPSAAVYNSTQGALQGAS